MEPDTTSENVKHNAPAYTLRNFVQAVLIFSLLSLIAIFPILLRCGTVGLMHDWNIPPLPAQNVRFVDLFASLWSPLYFGMVPYHYVSISYLFGLVSLLGVNGEVITKSCLFLALTFSGISSYMLCRKIGTTHTSALIASTFYMFTPVLFNRLRAGHIGFATTYACTPAIFYFFISALHSNNKNAIKNAILCGFFYLFAGSQIQFLFLLPFLLFVYSLYHVVFLRSCSFIKALSVFIISLSIGYSPYLMFLLPQFLTLFQTLNAGSVYSYKFTVTSWTNILKTTVLTGYGTAYFTNFISSTFLVWWYLPAFLLAAFALYSIYSSKFRNVFFWFILLVFFIYFGSGTSAPFGFLIWRFLYEHLPFLVALLGELYNLVYPISLSYTVLFAAATENFISNKERNERIIRILLILLLTILYTFPTIIAYQTSLQTYVLPQSYSSIYKKISEEEGNFRVLWIPTINEFVLFYPNTSHGFAGADPMSDFSPKPTFPQWFAPLFSQEYHGGVISYLLLVVNSQYSLKTAYLGDLLSLGAVKYILIREEVENLWFPPTDQTKRILQKQRDIKFETREDNILVYTNTKNMSMVDYATLDESHLLVGDLSSFVTLSYFTNENTEIPNPRMVVLASQLSSTDADTAANILTSLVFTPNNYDDLTYAHIPNEYRISLRDHLETLAAWNYETGWGYPTYDFSQWELISEPNKPVHTKANWKTLEIKFNAPFPANYTILAKVFFHPKSHNLSITIENRSFFVSTQSAAGEYFKWVRLENMPLKEGTHVVQIRNSGFAGIGAFAIVPSNILANASEVASRTTKNKNILIIFEAEDISPNQINADYGVVTFQEQEDASQGGALHIAKNATIFYPLNLPEGIYSLFIRYSSEEPIKMFIVNQTYSSHVFLPPQKNMGWRKSQIGSLIGNYTLRIETKNSSIDIFALKKQRESPSLKSNITFVVSQINPAYYRIISNSSEPLFIVHSENYNSFWKATEEDGKELQKLVANAFGEAYYVPPGNHELSLYFTKQNIFEFCRTIGIIVIILSLFLLVLLSFVVRTAQV